MLEVDIPYIMELALSNLDCTKDAPSVAAIDCQSRLDVMECTGVRMKKEDRTEHS